jgi:hypothetical protein
MKYKYRVRCIEAYTVEVKADKLVSQSGAVLAEVPGYSFNYEEGHESGFSTKSALNAFLKANPGKWVAI